MKDSCEGVGLPPSGGREGVQGVGEGEKEHTLSGYRVGELSSVPVTMVTLHTCSVPVANT